MLTTLLLSLLSTLPAGGNAAEGDARLNQICFVDAQHGWAVGDRGVVLHTDDGGQRWESQTSGVDCSLFSVCFVSDQLGWAAGGLTRPYTHLSSGVVLTTRDGGKTWNRDPNLLLPSLRQIGFFDPRHGWAVGCRSAMYPSGAFSTGDGGRTWRPLVGDNSTGWTAASFVNARTGLLAGRDGAIGLVRGGQLESIRAGGFELRSLTAATMLSPTDGWLVGEGGLVRRLTERPPETAVAPQGAAIALGGTAVLTSPGNANLLKAVRHFDLAAVAARGSHCWIAGNPGTRVFHTPDGGRTWQDCPTGTAVPLRALTFLDDQHGWAAGEFGTILATADGGRTWQRQHGHGARAALLCVGLDPEDIPLELVARLAGSEGYRIVATVLGRHDLEVAARGDVPMADRLHEAVLGVGGAAAERAWQFPLRQAGLGIAPPQIVDAWDRVNNCRGREELRARIVRAIRTWRPTVLVIGEASTGQDDPLSPVIRQAIVQAVTDAADPNALADQLVEAGLAAWRVARVFATVPSGERGTIELVSSQFSPALGQSLEDAAALPRGLLDDRYLPSPRMLGFRACGGKTAADAERRDFFAGLSVPPASESRRALPAPALDRLSVLQQQARKHRQAQAIVALAQRRGGSAERLLAQIDELTKDLDSQDAGQLFYQLGDHYHHSGRWPLAAETFEALVLRYPQHPLSPLAFRWLVQYYASGEAAWRVARDPSQQEKWRERAIAFGQLLERSQFEWFTQPGVRFPLAVAYRGLGQTRQADRLYQAQGRGCGHDAWWASAQAELHSSDAKSRATKLLLPCVKAEARPHLDGRLDDPVWQKANKAALHSAQGDDADWPATVMLAYDAEFLYLAIDCRRPNSANPTEEGTSQSRTRDADLSRHDRVEVFLDIDRDYATYYHFAIDDRGQTFDRCWEDATWDPTWFVASRQDSDRWAAEVAIPLKELVARPAQPRDAWAVGIQRVVPGVGFQSWSTPAAAAPLPDGFGWLMFE